jgi:acyl-coenzyme A thioesterase PaaI-like protein
VVGAQNVSRMCMVCGVENEAGLKGRFFTVEGGELVGVFRPRVGHQGYPGRMHGGLVSAILDETIGRAVSISEAQTWGVTIEFTIKFRAPVPLDREVKAIGRITRDSRRIFEGTGEIVLDDGTIAAEAQGKYMRCPSARSPPRTSATTTGSRMLVPCPRRWMWAAKADGLWPVSQTAVVL